MDRRLYWILVVTTAITVAMTNFVVLNQPSFYTVRTPNATMTVEGQFDRVELLDAHYGDLNGEYAIDEQVAVIYENGTVPIANTHYEGQYTQTLMNFWFRLQVYHDEHRVIEDINVMGGTTEEFVYRNGDIDVIVVISLDIDVEVNTAGGVVVLVFLAVLFAATVICIGWMYRPQVDDHALEV